MNGANTTAVFDLINAGLLLLRQAQAEGRDVTIEELSGLASAEWIEINKLQAKVDALP